MNGEFDKNEWFDVMREINPDLTREEFEADWEEFQKMKQARLRSMEIN